MAAFLENSSLSEFLRRFDVRFAVVAILSLFCCYSSRAEMRAYQSYIPSGVSFGMAIEQFQATRPGAVFYERLFEVISPTEQEFNLGELVENAAPFRSIFYHFKARKLAAFSWIYLRENPADVAEQIRTVMLSGFARSRSQQLRSSAARRL